MQLQLLIMFRLKNIFLLLLEADPVLPLFSKMLASMEESLRFLPHVSSNNIMFCCFMNESLAGESMFLQ